MIIKDFKGERLNLRHCKRKCHSPISEQYKATIHHTYKKYVHYLKLYKILTYDVNIRYTTDEGNWVLLNSVYHETLGLDILNRVF
jgi:hypothetical protein